MSNFSGPVHIRQVLKVHLYKQKRTQRIECGIFAPRTDHLVEQEIN